MLDDLNVFLKPVWGCHTLDVVKITEASMKAENDIIVIEAMVEVSARKAEFNMKISYFKSNSSNHNTTITRLDRYSLTSHCVQESEIRVKPYCICRL